MQYQQVMSGDIVTSGEIIVVTQARHSDMTHVYVANNTSCKK